jgi:hypothetical protein
MLQSENMNTLLVRLGTLSPSEVVAGLEREVRSERAVSARVIAWLSEVERRRLHVELGYSSLFGYCVEALGFSEDETCNRTGAVRAVLEYPQVLDMLEAGTLTMTAARLLFPHLKAQPDPGAVLASAAGKTRRQVELLIATLSPMPDAPTLVRRLPAQALPAQAAAPTLARPPAPTRPSPAATVAPLSPDRYRLQVTIGGEAVEKLRLAQDMLSHAVPVGDAAAVLERALDALLDQLARQRFSATEDPRGVRPAADGTRHIPAAVKRAVWIRDRGRCTYVGPTGHRCEERRYVQFQHQVPFTHGGPPTIDNIVLLCAAHNRLEAEKDAARFIRPGTGSAPPRGSGLGSRPAPRASG